MKLKEIIWLLSTDLFYITVGEKGVDETVCIEATAKNSYRELKKYFEHEVAEIIPDSGCVEIILKK